MLAPAVEFCSGTFQNKPTADNPSLSVVVNSIMLAMRRVKALATLTNEVSRVPGFITRNEPKASASAHYPSIFRGSKGIMLSEEEVGKRKQAAKEHSS